MAKAIVSQKQAVPCLARLETLASKSGLYKRRWHMHAAVEGDALYAVLENLRCVGLDGMRLAQLVHPADADPDPEAIPSLLRA